MEVFNHQNDFNFDFNFDFDCDFDLSVLQTPKIIEQFPFLCEFSLALIHPFLLILFLATHEIQEIQRSNSCEDCNSSNRQSCTSSIQTDVSSIHAPRKRSRNHNNRNSDTIIQYSSNHLLGEKYIKFYLDLVNSDVSFLSDKMKIIFLPNLESIIFRYSEDNNNLLLTNHYDFYAFMNLINQQHTMSPNIILKVMDHKIFYTGEYMVFAATFSYSGTIVFYDNRCYMGKNFEALGTLFMYKRPGTLIERIEFRFKYMKTV